MARQWSILIVASILFFTLGIPATATTIGATVSSTTSRIPECVTSLHLDNVSDPSLVGALVDSNLTLLLTIPSELVPSLAANRSNALRWLTAHVVPFFARTKIATISVGNNYREEYREYSHLLLPAIRNVYVSLSDLGISNISVSTRVDFIHTVTTPFPPSRGEFKYRILKESRLRFAIDPLLQFLRDTGSPFLVNVQPYALQRQVQVPVGFALFEEASFYFIEDKRQSTRYYNLFDMMVDSVISAIASAGYSDIPVIVTETGWPSSSTDPTETEASSELAQIYMEGLLRYVISGRGTPLSKQGISAIYMHAWPVEGAGNPTQSV